MKLKLYLFVLVIILGSTILNAQVVVIANKSVEIEKISKEELNDIYLIRTTIWDDGRYITVYDLKENNKSKQTFYTYLGKSNSYFKKKWMRLQLTGEGFPPKTIGSEYEILELVSKTPGAIGYIDASKVNQKVKILTTLK